MPVTSAPYKANCEMSIRLIAEFGMSGLAEDSLAGLGISHCHLHILICWNVGWSDAENLPYILEEIIHRLPPLSAAAAGTGSKWYVHRQ